MLMVGAGGCSLWGLIPARWAQGSRRWVAGGKWVAEQLRSGAAGGGGAVSFKVGRENTIRRSLRSASSKAQDQAHSVSRGCEAEGLCRRGGW